MLAPRLRQTLAGLLDGDSEKQVAAKLGLSRHTVHLYVGAIYRHFGVHSRGELLALLLRRRPHGRHTGLAEAVDGDGVARRGE
jgi:DNA-binding CsgD family transcriptional regulator